MAISLRTTSNLYDPALENWDETYTLSVSLGAIKNSIETLDGEGFCFEIVICESPDNDEKRIILINERQDTRYFFATFNELYAFLNGMELVLSEVP